MENKPATIDEAAAMLGQLTADDVAERLRVIKAEEKSLRVLLRTLRARESWLAVDKRRKEAAR